MRSAEGLVGHVTIAARQADIQRLHRDVGETVVVGGGVRSLFRTWLLARNSDVAVLGGGGLLEGNRADVNVHRLILEYVGKLAVCGLRGKRIAIHGIGISPDLYSSKLVNAAVIAVLRRVDIVSVRDPRSQGIAQSKGIPATLIRDPATVLFSHWASTAVSQQGVLGVVLLDRYRWPDFTRTTPEMELQRAESLRELSRVLVARTMGGAKVRVISFHWSDSPIAQDLRDAYLAEGGEPDRFEVMPYEQQHSSEPFHLLMACDAVFTMRFHPALAALASGAKVEIVGTLQKLEDLRSTNHDGNDLWNYPSSYGDPVAQLRHVLAAPDR